MYKSLIGIDVTHVPYRGGGDATTAVMANQVRMEYTTVPPVIRCIKMHAFDKH